MKQITDKIRVWTRQVLRQGKEDELHETKILRLANQSRKTHTPASKNLHTNDQGMVS